jgi:hypothetical protein
MKPNLIVAALAAAATWMAAGTAQAGGIIVDLREPTVRHHVFTNDNVLRTGSLAAAAAAAGSDGSGNTGGSGSSDGDASEFGKKAPAPINPHEILQIQAGLITEEEAMSGCGGASAATGPASLLPMLIACGALLRRRARTPRA